MEAKLRIYMNYVKSIRRSLRQGCEYKLEELAFFRGNGTQKIVVVVVHIYSPVTRQRQKLNY